MVRSHCLGPVVVALVLTGLAWGQVPSPQSTEGPPKTSSSRHPTITVEEPGQAPEKCRLLKFWLLSDGSKAYVAQALTSNEMLTIVQTGPSTGAAGQQGHPFQAAAMRIYHWGSSKTAPEGAPQPPANVPPVVLQPSSPTVINPSVPAGTTQRPLFGQASTTGRTWPSAYVDTSGKVQNNSTTQVQYTASPGTPNITPTPSCATCNQCACSPGDAVQGGTSTPASGAVSTPTKLAAFPAPQIIQGPATTTPSTAALAGQLNASTDSNQGNTAAPPAQSSPARRPGFFARLFQGDDQKPGATMTTVPAQPGPASQLLPLARVTPEVTAPAAVEVRRPALPALPELAPTAATSAPAATTSAATPSAMLPLAVVKPVLKPLAAALAGATKPVTAAPTTAVPAPSACRWPRSGPLCLPPPRLTSRRPRPPPIRSSSPWPAPARRTRCDTPDSMSRCLATITSAFPPRRSVRRSPRWAPRLRTSRLSIPGHRPRGRSPRWALSIRIRPRIKNQPRLPPLGRPAPRPPSRRPGCRPRYPRQDRSLLPGAGNRFWPPRPRRSRCPPR